MGNDSDTIRLIIEVEVDKYGKSRVGGNHFQTLCALHELNKKGYIIIQESSNMYIVTK